MDGVRDADLLRERLLDALGLLPVDAEGLLRLDGVPEGLLDTDGPGTGTLVAQ